jgi:hypothetical protein
VQKRTKETESEENHPQMRITASQNGWGLRYEIWEIDIMGYRTHRTPDVDAR